MIGRLEGKVAECAPTRVLVDVGGVGYEVQIPLSTYYVLSAAEDGRCRLHVHTHVREDALQLYGFATRQERSTFELLIGISGVGPRLALAILSGIGVRELEQAVVGRDRARLQRIPGVGRKTAERVLLELGDKLEPRERDGKAVAREAEPAPAEGVVADAVSALLNLGYARDAARRAVERAWDGEGDEPKLETVLRSALAHLVR